jgi:hypothetical protein
MYNSDPAKTAGPNGDGSKSLAKESKVGAAVWFLLFAAIQGTVDALNKVELEGQTGWWVTMAGAGVATAVAVGTAWLKKNR